MKISRILAWRVELPLYEATYKWSGGKSEALDKMANGAKEVIEREFSGWEMNINKSLLDSEQAETDHALELLEKMLD